MIVLMPDELIMALADGELEAPLAARVREAIRSDDEIRRKYGIFLGTRTLLSQTFKGVLAEPVPDRLTRAVAEKQAGRRLC